MIRKFGLVVVVALTAGACTAGPPDDGTTASPSPSKPTTSAPRPDLPTATPTATPTPTPTVPAGRPAWSADLGTGETAGTSSQSGGKVVTVDGMYVLTANGEVRGFTGKGEERWRREFPVKDKKSTSNTGPVNFQVADGALIFNSNHPTRKEFFNPQVVEAIDPANGKPLWKADSTPWFEVAGETVYTADCKGTQTGRPDDCRFSARDSRTGKPRWTVPTEHVPRVVSSSNGMIALATRPVGYRSKHWITVLNPATGKRSGARVVIDTFGESADLAGGTLVLRKEIKRDGETKEERRSRCDQSIRGLNARTGAERWKQILWAAKPKAGDYCKLDIERGTGNDLEVGGPGDRPQLIDLASGRTRWQAPETGTLVYSAKDVALLRHNDRSALTLYDLSSGKPRWTTPVPAGLGRTQVYGNRIVIDGDDNYCGSGGKCIVQVYDRSTGRGVLTASGTYAGAGPTWLATVSGAGSFDIYGTTKPH